MAPTAHAVLGASSSHRWMTCPGSVRLSAGIPNESSVYAEEGTAAHALCEHCLSNGYAADRFLGWWIVKAPIVFPSDAEWRFVKEANARDQELGFEVTEEMADAVQLYLDTVRADVGVGDELFIEHRFTLDFFRDGLFGTNDASVYKPKPKKLSVYDFKYGRGVPVEVIENPQLRYYGLGAMMSKPGIGVGTVEYVIVQPRCPHPDGPVRRWSEPALDLYEWSSDLVTAADATEMEGAPLIAGEHCKFCPAAPTCPELRNLVMETAKADFGANSGDLIVSEPQTFSSDQLAEILRHAGVIEDWVRRVRDFAHHEAEAGRVPTGFKIVATRATRKWKDEDRAIGFLTKYGLDKKDMYAEPKFKSPAQIEKVIGKKNKGDIAELVESISTGTVLAPLDDPRAPVLPEAAHDFEVVT